MTFLGQNIFAYFTFLFQNGKIRFPDYENTVMTYVVKQTAENMMPGQEFDSKFVNLLLTDLYGDSGLVGRQASENANKKGSLPIDQTKKSLLQGNKSICFKT